MPPLGTGVRDEQGWGMFHYLREVKKKSGRKVGGALHLFIIPPICTESTERSRRAISSPMAVTACVASEGHTGTAVAQQAGQDASVQLVEFHQLQQVCETGLAVIHAEVKAAFIFAWQDEIMFDFLQMAQRQNEALWVPLALPDQEYTIHQALLSN